MVDHGKKPKLQPPPRVRKADGFDTGTGSRIDRPSASRRQRGIATAIVVALALGLLAAFVLLPSWQVRRQDRVTDSTGYETVTATEIPSASTSEVPPFVAETQVLPTPEPSPTSVPIVIHAAPSEAPRSQPPTEEQQYVDAMSEGLAALEDGRWQAAIDAFGRASDLRPGAPEVADGLARARSGQRLASITEGIRRAGELERTEAWHDAERAYAEVLALDPESSAALEGQNRSSARATLDERLEHYIANPDRLSTSAVYADASATLEEAREAEPDGPRLESQISVVTTLLERASKPVAVILESDALTDVVVYRVGHQGRFTRRELDLRPGTYTVVGSRDGYRDVRLQLVVTPESAPAKLVVRCAEPL